MFVERHVDLSVRPQQLDSGATLYSPNLLFSFQDGSNGLEPAELTIDQVSLVAIERIRFIVLNPPTLLTYRYYGGRLGWEGGGACALRGLKESQKSLDPPRDGL